MTSQPSGELGPSEPSLMDIAADMDEQPGDVVETDESEELEESAETEEEVKEEDSEEEPEEEEEAEPEDPEFEVEGAKVKLSELRAGYMKDADYRRKTAEVAETKRSVEGQRQEVQQQREYLAKQTAPLLGLMWEQLIGSQDQLAELAHKDPAAWVVENQNLQQRAQRFEALKAENERLEQQRQADRERERAEFMEGERKILHEKLPEWANAKVAGAEQAKIAQYLFDSGYSPDELKELDHRDLLTARAAMQWHEHQKTVAAAKAKKGQPTPPERVVKPGASQVQPTQKQRRIAEASKRLNSNPNDLRSLAALAREGGF